MTPEEQAHAARTLARGLPNEDRMALLFFAALSLNPDLRPTRWERFVGWTRRVFGRRVK